MLNVGDLVIERVAATDSWERRVPFRAGVWPECRGRQVRRARPRHGRRHLAGIRHAQLASGEGPLLPVQGGQDGDADGARGVRGCPEPQPRRRHAGHLPRAVHRDRIRGGREVRLRGWTPSFACRTAGTWSPTTTTARAWWRRLGLTPDDATSIALLGYAGPEQAGNTANVRSGAEALLSRKFGGKVTTWLQLDFGQEEGAAAGGATAKWYAAGFWTAADLSAKVGLGVRADLVNDRDGARLSGALGYPANGGQTVSSLTATLNLKAMGPRVAAAGNPLRSLHAAGIRRRAQSAVHRVRRVAHFLMFNPVRWRRLLQLAPSIVVTFIALVSLGCQRDLTAWRVKLATPEVRRLAGSWQLDLSAIAMKPDSTPHTTGQIALTPNDERTLGAGIRVAAGLLRDLRHRLRTARFQRGRDLGDSIGRRPRSSATPWCSFSRRHHRRLPPSEV